MKRFYHFLIPLSLILGYNLSIMADDSIPATDLQEIVVKSERGWVENGVYNFIPSKKEKKLSNSPGSLIDVMNLPFLKGNGEMITTNTGEPVTIFINGQLASQTDLATFWPKLARKVEYMVNPSGGAYAGYKNVVNFVISEYQVGGVTKASVFQRIPNNGAYRIASKLNYKKMSYGALFEYNYNYDKPSTASEVSSYKDIYYNSLKYDEIHRISEQENRDRKKKFNFALNALYQTVKFRALHSFGLAWTRRPETSVTSKEEWSDNLFDSDSFQSLSSLKSLSPQVSGLYNYFILPDKFTMGGSWSYSFSRNNSASWSRFGDNEKISNSVDERVNALTANIYFNYYFSRKFIMQLLGKGSFSWFSSDYGGSVVEKSKQSRDEYSVQLGGFWYPSHFVNVVAQAGFMESVYKIDGTDKKYINPTAYIEGAWNPNRKLNMRLSLRTWMRPATSGLTNPVLIQSNDLLWISGNPLLKPQVTYMGDLSADYMPLVWMSASGHVSYERQFHTPYHIYEAAPSNMGGLIRTESNAAPFETVDAMIDFRFRIFDGNLSIGATPIYRFFKSRGTYARTLNNVSFNANASFIWKSFRFSAFYQGKDTKLSPAGTEILKQRDQFSLGVAYSYNDLYVNAEVQNIFHSKFKTYTDADYGVYSVMAHEASTGRRLALELTYTIGYGKKTNKNVSVTGPSSVESSIMSD